MDPLLRPFAFLFHIIASSRSPRTPYLFFYLRPHSLPNTHSSISISSSYSTSHANGKEGRKKKKTRRKVRKKVETKQKKHSKISDPRWPRLQTPDPFHHICRPTLPYFSWFMFQTRTDPDYRLMLPLIIFADPRCLIFHVLYFWCGHVTCVPSWKFAHRFRTCDPLAP